MAPPMTRQGPVLIVLAVGLLLRLAVWGFGLSDPERFLTPDSASYIGLASGILDSGMYGSEGQPEIFRAPGYPFFLSVVFVISRAPGLVVFFQVLLDGAVCWLVWRLARQSLGEGPAVAALAFQCVSVVSIVYACRVLSDTLFTFLFVLFLNSLWVSCQREGTPRFRGGALCGVLLAGMTYVRAVALPFGVLPVGLLLWRRRFRAALACAGTAALLLLPWYVRNGVRAGYPHFSSVGAILLYQCNAAMVLSKIECRPFAAVQEDIIADLSRYPTEQAQARHAMKQGRKIILQHPFIYTWAHLKTVPTNLLPATGELFQTLGAEIGGSGTLAIIRSRGILEGVRHYFRGRWGWFAAAVPFLALLGISYLLALVGFVGRAWAPSARPFFVFLGMTGAYFLLVPGGAAHPRYAVPAMPIISLCAGWGAWWLGTVIGWVNVKSRTTDEGTELPSSGSHSCGP